MRTLTQQERVLRSLVQAGQRGINRVDWLGREDTGTPDGGPPIINLPARIMELRQGQDQRPLWLPPRALLVMGGEARYAW